MSKKENKKVLDKRIAYAIIRAVTNGEHGG